MLNRDHPCASGLVAFHDFQVSGNRIVDEVSTNHLSVQSSATATQSGLKCITSANNTGAWGPYPPTGRMATRSSNLSVACRVRMVGTPGSNMSIYGLGYDYNNGSQYPYYMGCIRYNTSDQIICSNNNVDASSAVTSASILNRWVTLVAVWSLNNVKLYLDGTQIASATTFSFGSYGARTYLVAGELANWATRNPNLVLSWGACWDRRLTANEAALLAAMPPNTLEFPDVTKLSNTLAATFKAWLHYHRQIRS